MSQGAASQPAAAQVLAQALDVIQARLANRTLLSAEFRHVMQLDESITHSVDDSQLPSHLPLNRYWNILPYDYNRVQTDKLPYVNASHISLPDRTRGHVFRYIATQGPLPTTARDFWSMILLLRVPVVIMLTGIVEKGTVKCAPYFPTAAGEVLDLEQGVTVTCVDVQEGQQDDPVTVRSMRVTDSAHQPPTSFTTQHYQFKAWPDHGTPRDGAAILRICRALQANRAAAPQRPEAHLQGVQSATDGPPEAVVHCSAGIGRTGTFMAIDVMRERLMALARSGANPRQITTALDLPTLVHELRQQRMYSVQTFEQYAFIYQCLTEDLREALAAQQGQPAGQQQQ